MSTSVTVSASRTNSQNDVIFTTVVGADPSGETIEYTLSSGVNDSYEIGTTDLFQLNNGKLKPKYYVVRFAITAA